MANNNYYQIYNFQLLVGSKHELLFAYSPCVDNECDALRLKQFLRYSLKKYPCCKDREHLEISSPKTKSVRSFTNLDCVYPPIPLLDPPVKDEESAIGDFIVCTCEKCEYHFPETFNFGFLLMEKMHNPKIWVDIGKLIVSCNILVKGTCEVRVRFLVHKARKKIYMIGKLENWRHFSYPARIGSTDTIYNMFVKCKSREASTLRETCLHFMLLNW